MSAGPGRRDVLTAVLAAMAAGTASGSVASPAAAPADPVFAALDAVRAADHHAAAVEALLGPYAGGGTV